VHTDIPELLIAHGGGDPEALHRLVPLVYDDLRRIARVQLRRRRPGQTLETTCLVHEAYLRPQMETGRWRISTSGGTSPRWSPDGRELFYVDEEGLMVVPIAQASTFATSAARRLFKVKPFGGRLGADFEVSPDGRRFLFLMEAPPVTPRQSQLIFVQGCVEELRARLVRQ
jgi:dipeptidyl aminopeptidase/acylaminoacyl peptidase